MTEKSGEQSLLSEMRAAIQGDSERASMRQTGAAKSDRRPHSATQIEAAPARRGWLDRLLRRP